MLGEARLSLMAVSQVPPVAVSRGSRSQLATKGILVRLGQVFGSTGYTSREAEIRLGLDFLYVSKELSRMATRPYNYLSVVRKNPRQIGGFENVYIISKHGWSKIKTERDT
ncbi:MAG: hypothetical protein ABSA92_15430 [Candidatus Bathyarchaeia archaeon]|jgi:hypothetical protein